MTYTTHISITEAKQNLGELIKRVAYGGERFVLEFRGRPMATMIPYEKAASPDFDDTMERLRVLRERSAEYGRGVTWNTVDEIRKLREGQTDEWR